MTDEADKAALKKVSGSRRGNKDTPKKRVLRAKPKPISARNDAIMADEDRYEEWMAGVDKPTKD